MKYSDNGVWKPLRIKATDTLPVGAIVDYDGDTVPNGYVEVEDHDDKEVIISNTEPTENNNKLWVEHGEELYDKSNIELSKSWHSGYNSKRARIVLDILPNETYNVKVSGTIANVVLVECAVSPTSSSSTNVYATQLTLGQSFTNKATSTSKYLILQFEASDTISQDIINALQVSIYYGDNGIKVNNNGEYETVSYKNIYSTGETIVGEFLGKPLYRKVYKTGTISSGITRVDNFIGDFNEIIKIDCMGKESGGNWILIPKVHDNTFIYQIGLYFHKTENKFIFETGSSTGLEFAYLIVEYTKTTDDVILLSDEDGE